MFDDDICALVDDESRDHERVHLISLEVASGTKQKSQVKLEISVDGAIQYAAVSGNGPVDAAFRAIGEAFPHSAELALFSVANVTEGTDAQARTTVRLQENGKLVDGQGADADTVVSAVRAYIHALNKLLTKRERTEPEAL